MAIEFGGKQVRRPGAYSQTDSSKMTPASTGSFKVLAVVGEAPNTTLTSKSEVVRYGAYDIKKAEEEIGTGELLSNMKTAWKHGADLLLVSIVYALDEVAGVADSDWDSALTRLEREDLHGIIPVTTTDAIQVKVDEHVVRMSGVLEKKERRAFYGHPSGLTATEVASFSTILDGSRGLLATPAVYDLDANGTRTLYDSVRLASAMAGVWASKEDQDPITFDEVDFIGLETHYKQSEIGDLIDAGVAPVEFADGIYRIVQGVTMSTSTDLTKRELSVATAVDTMNQRMRKMQERKHVGEAGATGIEVTIYNDAISEIESYLKDGLITAYVQESVRVVKDNTSFFVEWEGKPTLPMNNFFTTSHFTL